MDFFPICLSYKWVAHTENVTVRNEVNNKSWLKNNQIYCYLKVGLCGWYMGQWHTFQSRKTNRVLRKQHFVPTHFWGSELSLTRRYIYDKEPAIAPQSCGLFAPPGARSQPVGGWGEEAQNREGRGSVNARENKGNFHLVGLCWVLHWETRGKWIIYTTEGLNS